MIAREPKILAVASQGAGSHDEDRLRALLSRTHADFFPFDRSRKLASFKALLAEIARTQPDLVCLEGTGIAAGAALLVSKLLRGTRYVVSSGDAVGPFVAAQVPALSTFFGAYEKALCSRAAGFVGWTPYLTGRALTYGAPRAMTAPGWAPFALTGAEKAKARSEIRAQLGIPESALVIGIAGSLAWNDRVRFCYGKECVEAVLGCAGHEIHALVVGDGTGLAQLEKLAGDALGKTIHLTGRVPREKIPAYLAAMDLASLPQSVDQVGSFRYSTKLPEYVEAGLPVVTGEIPLSYDLPQEGFWRLAGDTPWDSRYVQALSGLLRSLSPASSPQPNAEIRRRASAIEALKPQFDRDAQIERFTQFLDGLLSGAKKG